MYYWAFSRTQRVTHASTNVAYSDFTNKSPDYILTKADLFSTKLSQTVIAWTLLKDIHVVTTFSSFSWSRNYMRVSARVSE